MTPPAGSKQPVSDINVTPLVDVVLVLLITFMVTAPLAEKQMFMHVPQDEPSTQAVPPQAVPPEQTVLTLFASGRVLLDRQPMTVDEAMRQLQAVYQGHPSKVLFFNAEDAASYALAVQVLDRARRAGVNTIGMVTDPPLVGESLSPAGGEGKGAQPTGPSPSPQPSPHSAGRGR